MAAVRAAPSRVRGAFEALSCDARGGLSRASARNPHAPLANTRRGRGGAFLVALVAVTRAADTGGRFAAAIRRAVASETCRSGGATRGLVQPVPAGVARLGRRLVTALLVADFARSTQACIRNARRGRTRAHRAVRPSIACGTALLGPPGVTASAARLAQAAVTLDARGRRARTRRLVDPRAKLAAHQGQPLRRATLVAGCARDTGEPSPRVTVRAAHASAESPLRCAKVTRWSARPNLRRPASLTRAARRDLVRRLRLVRPARGRPRPARMQDPRQRRWTRP